MAEEESKAGSPSSPSPKKRFHFKQDHYSHLEKIYNEKDPSASGLSKEDFLALLAEVKQKGEPELDPEEIYRTLNWESSKKVFLKDFVDAVKKLVSSQTPTRPRTFSLESVFGKLIHVKPIRWTDEQHQRAQKYFSDYDTDSSGSLSYSELLQMIQHVQAKRRMLGVSEEELNTESERIIKLMSVSETKPISFIEFLKGYENMIRTSTNWSVDDFLDIMQDQKKEEEKIDYESLLAAEKEKTEALKQQLENAHKEISHKDQLLQMKESQDKSSKLQQRLKEIIEKNVALAQTDAESKQNLKDAQTKITSLETLHKEAMDKYSQLENQLNEAQERNRVTTAEYQVKYASLESELTNVKTANEILLSNKESQLNEAEAKITELEQRLKHSEEQRSTAISDLEQRLHEAEENKSSATHLEATLKHSQDKTSALEAELTKLKADIQSLSSHNEEQVKEVQAKNTQLQQQLKDEMDKNTSWGDQVKQYRESQASLEEELKKLKAAKESLTADSQAQMKETHSKNVELEQRLKDASDQKAAVEAQLKELQNKLLSETQTKDSTVAEMESKQAALSEELQHTKEELASKEENHKQLVSTLAALETQLQELKKKTETEHEEKMNSEQMKGQITELKNQLKEALTEKNSVENSKHALQNELQILKKELSMEKETQQHDSEQLTFKYSEAQAELQQATENLTALNKKHTDLQITLQQHEQKVLVQENDLKAKTEQVAAFETKAKDLENQIQDLIKENVELSKKNSQMESETKVVQARLSMTEEKQEMNLELKKEIETVKGQLEEAKNRCKGLEEDIEKLTANKTQAENSTSELEKLNNELQAENSELEKKFGALEEQHKRTEGKIKEQATKFSCDLKQVQETENQRYSEIKNDYEKIVEQFLAEQQKNVEAQEKSANIHNELAVLKSQLQEAQTALTSTKQEYSNFKLSVEKQQEKKAQDHKKMEQIKKQVQTLANKSALATLAKELKKERSLVNDLQQRLTKTEYDYFQAQKKLLQEQTEHKQEVTLLSSELSAARLENANSDENFQRTVSNLQSLLQQTLYIQNMQLHQVNFWTNKMKRMEAQNLTQPFSDVELSQINEKLLANFKNNMVTVNSLKKKLKKMQQFVDNAFSKNSSTKEASISTYIVSSVVFGMYAGLLMFWCLAA